jgi:hypothetical protein
VLRLTRGALPTSDLKARHLFFVQLQIAILDSKFTFNIMTRPPALDQFHNISELRSLQAKISSAIDQYERVQDNRAALELANGEIAKAASELLSETEDPLKRIFLISHQVREHMYHDEA